MNEPQLQIYEFGDFRLDAAKRLLTKGVDEPLPLTPKVFDTLLYLVQHNGRVIGKDELMREVWIDSIVEENNLSQNISILRRVLGEKPGEGRFITTVPGHGFRFIPEVREASEVPSSKFQVPSSIESEISNSESNDESPTKSAPETRNLKLETNQQPKPKTDDRNPNRFRFAAFAVLIILVLGSLGFYLWRENEKSVADARIKSIAVLPFKPLVAEHRDEALEIGMADTLIARLGDNQKIIVRPLSSVRRFGNLEQDAVQAGRALDVEAVLDGSIQRWGDVIRVNVRLIRVADGTALWTGTFDEKSTGIFVVQDAISKRVTAALAMRLSADEQANLKKRSTESVEAYELYLRGRYHFFKITQPEILKAIVFYEQAIEADPNYALAYAGIADAYRTLPIAGFVASKEAFPQARAAAKRALEIDDTLAEAHTVLGWVGFWFDWDWEAAETEFKRAIELSPNNSDAHRAYAHLLSNTGRHDEAVAMGRRARELDPLTLITNALEGQFLFFAGRDTEAIARYDKTLEIEPDFWVAHNGLGRVYIRQERYPEAIAALTKARELSRGSTEPVMQLGYALAKSGNRKQAQETLEELKSAAAEKFVSAYSFAMIYNGLGEKDEALSYLEKSFQEREVQITFVKIDTRWDELRSEPRFVDLMRRMNFE
ncbi:MAG: tetratricopeptide repeat protein [Pyrinomonadaceae bacterium]